MHRTIITTTLALFIAATLSFAGESPASSNEYVKCTVGLRQRMLKAGATGTILITLEPKKGIHINLTPPISVALDSTGVVVASSTRELPKVKTYLDTSKPIKYSFTLSGALKPGPQVISGVLTYFYCSDADGWCSKFKQPINLKIDVVK